MMAYQIYGLNIISDYIFNGWPSIQNDLTGTDDNLSSYDLSFSCSQSPPFQPDWKTGNLIFSYRYPIASREWRDELYKFPDFYVWRFVWGGDFYIGRNRIDCCLHDPAKQDLVEQYLAGAILAFWLEQNGIPTLHGSTVAVGERALAFLAHSGNGKSTLALGSMKAGARLLTDDVLPIEYEKDTWWARPGLPLMNLRMDQLSYFGEKKDINPASQGAGKQYISAEMIANGIHCRDRKPLSCIYLPRKFDPVFGGNEIEITPVISTEAVIELARYSYIPPADTEKLGWQARRLESFTRLVRQVPIRRLIYPSGFEHLSRVTKAVMEDLEKISH